MKHEKIKIGPSRWRYHGFVIEPALHRSHWVAKHGDVMLVQPSMRRVMAEVDAYCAKHSNGDIFG